MPIVYEDPSLPKRPEAEFEAAVATHTASAAELLANQTATQAARVNDILTSAGVNDTSLYHVPDTLVWTGVQENSTVTTAVVNDATLFFAGRYGNEDLAAFWAADIIADPVSRERTMATLAYLRGYATTAYTANGTPIFTVGGQGTQERGMELLRQVIGAGGSTAGLTTAERAQVGTMAKELYANLQTLPDTGTSLEFKTAVAVGISGDFSLALDAEQLATLEKLQSEFNQLGGFRQTGETLTLASVGIEQVRQLNDGVIVMDRDWAKANPAEAYAVETWLHQNRPELEIQYGREGVLGSLLDKAGMGVDYLTAPFAAGALQLKEFGEQLSNSPEDRAKMLARADELEQQLTRGEVPDANVERTLSDIALLRDVGTVEVGWQQYKDDVFRNANARVAGFGFADTIMRSSGMMPGDPGYGAVYAVVGLLSNIIADPLNIGLLALTGARSARLIATLEKGAVPADVGRGMVRAMAYRALAKTPEEMLVTRPMMQAADKLYEMRTALGADEFAGMLGAFYHDERGLGGGAEAAHLLSQATSSEDMALAMVSTQFPIAGGGLPIEPLMERMNEATRLLDREAGLPGLINASQDPALVPGLQAELDALQAEHADLIAQRGLYSSVVEGAEWTRPVRQVFSSRQIRRLERLTGERLDARMRAFEAATESVEGLPADVLRAGPDAIAAHLAAHPEVEATTANLMRRARRAFTPSGAGEVLTFPHTSDQAAAVASLFKKGRLLADHKEESFARILGLGRRFGLSDSRVEELMRPWVAGELTGPSASYRWWTKTWESFVDESPLLGAAGKEKLAKMWDTPLEGRPTGLIETRGASGFGQYEPVWYKSEVNPVTGLLERKPLPDAEAYMFQTWTAPSDEAITAYISHTQRTTNEWRATGGWARRDLSLAHLGLSQLWSGWNHLWRTGALIFRPIAWPARVMSEEMVRMAVFGYHSLVHNPMDWFLSTGLGTRLFKGTDYALMGESPTHALGGLMSIMENNPNLRLAAMGTQEVSITSGPAFWRSYADTLSRQFASPTVRAQLQFMDHPASALAALEASDDGAWWLAHVAETDFTPLEAIARKQEQLRQLLGSGEGADIVRTALRRGAVSVDGEVVEVGSDGFAALLEKMANDGSWVPGISTLPRSAGDYLPVSRMKALTESTGRAFSFFATAPDNALARSALWRQMAAREFRDLLRRGYSEETALKMARAWAARGTRDTLFTIGARTPGEVWLRNVNPFFPAYRELADTWLIRAGQRLGNSSWALGVGKMGRRTDIWMDFFSNMGIIRRDENGKMYVPIPGLGNIISMFTGANVEVDARAPLDSFAGILPTPLGLFDKDEEGNPLPWYKRLQGLLPTLGGPSTFVLGAVNDLFGGKLDAAENWLTLYGTDASQGPTSIDRALEAFGFVAPWMTATTRDMHEATRTWAVVDGMRIAAGEKPAPDYTEFDADGDGILQPDEMQAYAAADRAWKLDLLDRGERYAQRFYLLRSITSAILPFSVSSSDEAKQQMGAIWTMLNAIPDEAGGGEFKSAMLDAILAEYPQLGAYMTGKTQDIRPGIVKPEESLEEWMQAVKDGGIKVRNATDWAVFAAGMNSYSIYQSRIDAIFEEAGPSAADWLLNFAAKEEVAQEKAKWQVFLDASEVKENWLLPEQKTGFATMFKDYFDFKAMHEGETTDLTLEQQRLLDLTGLMREFSLSLTPNEPSTDDYYKLRDQAYAALGPPKGEIGKGVDWWFSTVNTPYYDKLHALADVLDATEPRNQAPIYAQMNAVRNDYYHGWTDPEHPEWGEFVSPEEYGFVALTPEEQTHQVAAWANLPAGFLSQFQREQVGYDIPEDKQDAASALVALVDRANRKFEKYVVQHDLSYASTAVKDARAKLDGAFAGIAEERGLSAFWKQANMAEYQRVDLALNLSETSASWKRVARLANSLRSYIESQDYVPGGSSALAEQGRTWFVNMVTNVRGNDAGFDSLMSDLQVALGDKGSPLAPQEIVETLFFDVWSTSNSFYLDRRR